MTDCKNCKYTDEYCTSGDCNKIQTNNLACNKISLTEQWKKGELPEGFYYVNDGVEVTIDYYLCDYWERHFGWDIQQIIAPVPSYDELQNMNEAVNECMAANIKLVEQNKQLKEQINKYYLDVINRGTANAVKAVKEFGMPERIKELVEQNAQLKELLKRARGLMGYVKDWACTDAIEELLTKIDEVLK